MSQGHLRQIRPGAWRIWVELEPDPLTGKRRQHTKVVRGNKDDAQAKLHEILRSVETNIYVPPSKLTLGEFLNQWMNEYALPTLRGRTPENYRAAIERHILPALGRIQLAKLQPQHLQRYYALALTSGRRDKKGGLSPTTVRYHHAVLHRALEHAYRWQLIGRNIADLVDPPRPAHFEPYILELEDIVKFLDTVSNHRLFPVYVMAVTTGLREGELIGLRWQDVNLGKGTMRVRQSLQTRKGIHVGAPKTDSSRRPIALPRLAVNALIFRKDQQELERDFFGDEYIESDMDLIFGTPRGAPLNARNLVRHFKSALKAAGLPSSIRFHDLRHAHTTMLLLLGVDPKTVQERLGHSQISMTMDIYAHVTTKMQEAAARKIDEAMKGVGRNLRHD